MNPASEKRRGSIRGGKDADMKKLLAFGMVSLGALGWFLASESVSLLLLGAGLTGVGLLSRRMRSAPRGTGLGSDGLAGMSSPQPSPPA